MNVSQGQNQGQDQLARKLRRCEAQLRAYAEDLNRAARELVASRRREVAFAEEQEAALLHVAKLTADLAHLQVEQARLGGLLLPEVPPDAAPQIVQELDLHAEIARLLQHRDEAHRLRQSLSWRVTRPLRALRRPRRTLRILLDRMGGH